MILCAAKRYAIRFYGGISACGLNHFGHIQIFMVSIYAKLQRIIEMAICYVAKHNRLPLKSLLFSRTDSMRAEEGVEVCAVDVDFAADLREGNYAFVAIVLPCLWRDSEDFACIFGFYPFAVGIFCIATGDQVHDVLQRIMEVSPFFFGYDKK